MGDMAETYDNSKMTIWPEFVVPESIKIFISNFYKLVDTDTREASKKASRMFVPDGKMVINERKVIEGHYGQ